MLRCGAPLQSVTLPGLLGVAVLGLTSADAAPRLAGWGPAIRILAAYLLTLRVKGVDQLNGQQANWRSK